MIILYLKALIQTIKKNNIKLNDIYLFKIGIQFGIHYIVNEIFFF